MMNRGTYNQNSNIIHARLRKLRKEAKLSQGQLAAQMQLRNVNIDQQTISLIEHNKRFASDYEVACLCDIFHVTPTELLSDFEALGGLDENK